jgi:hypothetical protein
MSETLESKDTEESSSKDISDLKDEMKSKEATSKKNKDKKVSIDKSMLLYKNNINIKHPKYLGRTRALLFIGETPIFILCENSKYYYNNIKYFI